MTDAPMGKTADLLKIVSSTVPYGGTRRAVYERKYRIQNGLMAIRANKPPARCLVVLLSLCLGGFSLQSQSKQIELELVLALDTSSSVDPYEFELQKRGLAEAFRHPDVLKAIESCGGEDIAVTVVQWSGNRMHLVAVDWMIVRNRESAEAFARAVESTRRLLSGFTGLNGAIRYSLRLIEENDLDGRRKTIDISGDGSSSGHKPTLERDRAVRRGATINGLAILTNEPDLETYYAAHVVGGDRSFVMSVGGFDGFATAIRKKLSREIRCPRVAHISIPSLSQ